MCKRFERMMKCLELTASTNDAEALAAMRAANKIREELGLKWSDFANPNPGEQDWIKDLARKWQAPESEEQKRQREEAQAAEYKAYQDAAYKTAEASAIKADEKARRERDRVREGYYE